MNKEIKTKLLPIHVRDCLLFEVFEVHKDVVVERGVASIQVVTLHCKSRLNL